PKNSELNVIKTENRRFLVTSRFLAFFRTMKNKLFAAFVTFLLVFPIVLRAQTQTNYTVTFPNLVHHEAEITAEFIGVPSEILEVRMARSSPGRYALHEFAKNV